jgi:hypothetical protein
MNQEQDEKAFSRQLAAIVSAALKNKVIISTTSQIPIMAMQRIGDLVQEDLPGVDVIFIDGNGNDCTVNDGHSELSGPDEGSIGTELIHQLAMRIEHLEEMNDLKDQLMEQTRAIVELFQPDAEQSDLDATDEEVDDA